MWLLYYQFLEKCLKRSAIFLNGKYFYKGIERVNVGLFKNASILCGFSLRVKYWENCPEIPTSILTYFDILLYILWFHVFWSTGVHSSCFGNCWSSLLGWSQSHIMQTGKEIRAPFQSCTQKNSIIIKAVVIKAIIIKPRKK